jgi:hypothetical protein
MFIPTLFAQFIFEAAATHCFEMAIHRHGCCVLQKCITSARGEHQAKLIVEVCAHAFQLAQDPFGYTHPSSSLATYTVLLQRNIIASCFFMFS